jgi:hypothetical protein
MRYHSRRIVSTRRAHSTTYYTIQPCSCYFPIWGARDSMDPSSCMYVRESSARAVFHVESTGLENSQITNFKKCPFGLR